MEPDKREIVAHLNNMITELREIKSCYGADIHDSKKEAITQLEILVKGFTLLAGREAVTEWVARPKPAHK